MDFFNQINMLYGTITEFCTEDRCPIMSAGPKYEYHWADGQTVKKPIKCSAPKYIDYLMTWVQDQLDDENIFPSKIGVKFPPNFQSIVKTILKRLFRVYAHIYHQHFKYVNGKWKRSTQWVISFNVSRFLSLQRSCFARWRSSLEHFVQALHILCTGELKSLFNSQQCMCILCSSFHSWTFQNFTAMVFSQKFRQI